MFNLKAFSLLVAASLFGVGAAFFANDWLKQQASAQVVKAVIERKPVLVAAREVDFGQKITEADIRVVEWPVELLPTGVIGQRAAALGRTANQKLLEGEPLLSERLVDKISGSALSAKIAPNKRAVSVRVNDVAGVAGFLLPGNRVDVLGTRMISGRANTSTVLQNVKVLAVDQKAALDKDEPAVVRAVTLEADIEESISLVKATQEGSVQLVLRNPKDKALHIAATPVRPTAARRTAPAVEPLVRVIRGTSVNSLFVQN